MSNRLILPAKYQQPITPPPGLRAAVPSVVESAQSIYLQHLQRLIDDSLRDMNGGVLPTNKARKKFLKGIRHDDGCMFYWRNKPMLYVSNPKFVKQPNGALQMNVVDKRMYKDEQPEQPVKASN